MKDASAAELKQFINQVDRRNANAFKNVFILSTDLMHGPNTLPFPSFLFVVFGKRMR